MSCIPDYPATPSQRARCFSRGTFQTGTASGFGFIAVSPDYGVASDGICGFKSTSGFAGTAVDLTGGATVTTISTNSQYLRAGFTTNADGIAWRIVGSGLRVRYDGTELNRGGQIYALVEPTRDSLDGMTEDTMMAHLEAKKFSVSSREWTTVLYKPTFAGSTFSLLSPSNATVQTKAAGFTRANYMGFIVKSPNPGTITITMEYEFFNVYEFQGPTVTGIQPSHVDQAGFSAVHTASMNGTLARPTQQPTHKTQESFFEEIGDYLLRGLTWVGDHAGEISTVVGTIAAFL